MPISDHQNSYVQQKETSLVKEQRPMLAKTLKKKKKKKKKTLRKTTGEQLDHF